MMLTLFLLRSTTNLKLDMSRNRLLGISTFIELAGACFTFGGFIGSIFGEGRW